MPDLILIAVAIFKVINFIFQPINACSVKNELCAAALDTVCAVLITVDILFKHTAGSGRNEINAVLPAHAHLLAVARERLNIQHRFIIDSLPAGVSGLARVLGHNSCVVGAGPHKVSFGIAGAIAHHNH